MTRPERIERLLTAIPKLSDYRLQLIDRIVRVFSLPRDFWNLKIQGSSPSVCWKTLATCCAFTIASLANHFQKTSSSMLLRAY